MQVLFQLNDLNHDVDLFFLHCCQVDFLTFPGFHISIFHNPGKSGNVFDTKREKKGGCSNSCDGEVKLSRVESSCDGRV